jgi:hypothetical protein
LKKYCLQYYGIIERWKNNIAQRSINNEDLSNLNTNLIEIIQIFEFNLENLIKVDNIKFYKDLQTAHFFI